MCARVHARVRACVRVCLEGRGQLSPKQTRSHTMGYNGAQRQYGPNTHECVVIRKQTQVTWPAKATWPSKSQEQAFLKG